MSTERKFLWLDFETTGLEERECYPIEVAAVVTDHALNMIDSYCSTIIVPQEHLAKMNDWCQKTHTKSGLIEECLLKGLPIREVEKGITDLIRRNFGQRAVLAGSSVHFDRKFVKQHFSEVEKLLHYRIVDVSSFMEGYRISLGYDVGKNNNVAHRATQDIYQSIKLYHRLISMVRLPGQAKPESEVLVEALNLLREILITPAEESLLGPTENTMIERPYWLHVKIRDLLKRQG